MPIGCEVQTPTLAQQLAQLAQPRICAFAEISHSAHAVKSPVLVCPQRDGFPILILCRLSSNPVLVPVLVTMMFAPCVIVERSQPSSAMSRTISSSSRRSRGDGAKLDGDDPPKLIPPLGACVKTFAAGTVAARLKARPTVRAIQPPPEDPPVEAGVNSVAAFPLKVIPPLGS